MNFPSNPQVGQHFVDANNRTIHVFDGSKWVLFTEAQLVEMEIEQQLILSGRTAEEAKHMIYVLKNSNG